MWPSTEGGCFETSHATTHAEPTYEVDGASIYCVANMPGAVPLDVELCAQQCDFAVRAGVAVGGIDAVMSFNPHLKRRRD